jgi:hypothetical protein
MNVEEKKALLHSSLERAAEQLGDITPHVMAAYYARHPGARQRFEELHPGNPGRLEGEMVEQVLYCLMEWYDSPGEIEVIFMTTVPHHVDTLHVWSGYFSDLITAVCETVVATITPAQVGERAVWQELERDLLELARNCASFTYTDGLGHLRQATRRD